MEVTAKGEMSMEPTSDDIWLSNGDEPAIEYSIENGIAARVNDYSAPDSLILERFARLHNGVSGQILYFAQKYGPLYLNSYNLPAAFSLPEDGVKKKLEPTGVEKVSVWKTYARIVRSIMRIIGNIQAGDQPDALDWTVLEHQAPVVGSRRTCQCRVGRLRRKG